ncbi:MAG: hypothetical protein ACKOLA_13355, partial [Spartobacteria bacterium]
VCAFVFKFRWPQILLLAFASFLLICYEKISSYGAFCKTPIRALIFPPWPAGAWSSLSASIAPDEVHFDPELPKTFPLRM